eukprot:CAMPEP_0194304448 /NCGR_PEP_ID=MMETSP0171-20130528/2215_1 /TAXON_ID=218684 /ORGANISM="Corethron pennatum, Strain L29A3" /LENGTH=334 /DNA_ID=CAMNT_0039055753 /DNA_START=49 /DNA_END=1053 /DNA_ORIENTATION=+
MTMNPSSRTESIGGKHNIAATCNDNNIKSRSGVAPPIMVAQNPITIPQEPATSVVNGSSTFPSKLHSILTSGQWSDVIQFEADGRKWKVLDKKRMEEEVLPVNFRHNKYLSFTRSVVGWGFKRAGKATYYHELFIRDAPQLCLEMSRKTVLKDEPNNQPSTNRCRNNIMYSGTNQNDASFQVPGLQQGILSPHSRLQQTTPIEQGIGSNIQPLRIPSQNEMANTARRQNIFHGIPPMGIGAGMGGVQRHASSQYDGRYPSHMQHVGLNPNSPPVHYNNQGIPINQMSHDYMYHGSSSDLQYSSLHGQMSNNGQSYVPGPVPYIYDQAHNGNVGI